MGIWGQKKVIYRAANNGRSTGNVRSELGIDRTNPWIAGHLVQSFYTDSLREILILRGTTFMFPKEKEKNKNYIKLDK